MPGLLAHRLRPQSTGARMYNFDGHGWASVHSVAWAYDAADGEAIIERPPTGHNDAIGGFETFTGAAPPAPFQRPQGYIEGTERVGLYSESLHEQQVDERACPAR